ncbi:MAG: DNA methyltransferase, partial [Phenylobacterium sp.]
MSRIRLFHGDCLDALRQLPHASVDAVVTDPPYGLSFMGRRWDYDVPSVEIWAECLRVLKPGGHLLAFAGTRTQHRMAVRIEDAGFEIRDMIAWVYGSGFPKSLDVSKAIDKAAGAEREVVGSKLGLPGYSLAEDKGRNTYSAKGRNSDVECSITAPATDAARQWQGWGTALKPSLEPLTVARKPLSGTVAANVLEHGTGALNIDGCRVEGAPRTTHAKGNVRGKSGQIYGGGSGLPSCEYEGATARWPANLIHDG